ncbi:1-acyl-sn-glycerol-3-phosphate acyltransferase [Roseovarius sp. SCSIO 43702]|nr:1-acyl-sn-glycerol-3-phosphate acyltransferase [Roseovarius sp. SCSIO 43702]
MSTSLVAGVIIKSLMRLVERPLCGERRPVTPWITRTVCRQCLALMGLRVETRGTPLREAGAMVANHASWLDIFVLNSVCDLYFVSKAEVASWPGIGLLARITGTVFIARRRGAARAQTELFRKRLAAGHRLLFFPEGTSTDGMRVLTFKTTLFEAFLSPELREDLHVQPVTVIYEAPEGQPPRFYGWWGEMEFGPHLLKVLAAPRQGCATVVYHRPVKVSDFEDRKALARYLEAEVRGAMPPDRQLSA